MFDLNFLSKLRMRELDFVSCEIKSGARILEFGAGAGTQALELQARGFEVLAIDLMHSDYYPDRVFPVIDYDGRHIPFPDQSIDIIFSSNVLEHVEDLPQILEEFRRVLSPEGYCVHLMPSVAWRAWTFATGFPTALVAILHLIRDLLISPNMGRAVALRKNLKAIAGGLLPLGHGTSIEGISELWTFSVPAWRAVFCKAGFTVDSVRTIGVFHTGNMLAGSRLSISHRERIAQLLGGAANIFIVRPTAQRPE